MLILVYVISLLYMIHEPKRSLIHLLTDQMEDYL
nr:MAG TPA: hypothetical protein [Caudoviricetes sp.]